MTDAAAQQSDYSPATFAIAMVLLSAPWADQFRIQCTLHRPSAFNPLVEKLRGHTDCRSPVSNTHCLPVVGNHLGSAVVPGLLCVSGPGAVAGTITGVVIKPFDAMAIRWSWPHVGVEVFKRVKPSLAYCNPPASISLVRASVFSCASLYHSVPNTIFGAVRHSVRCVYGDNSLSLQATAGAAFTLVQAGCYNTLFSAAFAPALPESTFPRFGSEIFNYSPSSDCFSAKVFYVLRKANSIYISHETFLLTEGNLWIEPASVQPLVRLASFYHKPRKFGVV